LYELVGAKEIVLKSRMNQTSKNDFKKLNIIRQILVIVARCRSLLP